MGQLSLPCAARRSDFALNHTPVITADDADDAIALDGGDSSDSGGGAVRASSGGAVGGSSGGVGGVAGDSPGVALPCVARPVAGGSPATEPLPEPELHPAASNSIARSDVVMET